MVPSFDGTLRRCLRAIPEGHVATCGTVAVSLGDVRASRAVATWLADHPDAAGARRVVRADGSPILRDALPTLLAEGVRVEDGRVPASLFVRELPPTRFLLRLREEQQALAARVSDRDDMASCRWIAGVDASYRGEESSVAAVVCDAEDLHTVEAVRIRVRVRFPYVPTYLGYRELPGIEAALGRLVHRPDVLLVDGHGQLHPAGFGIACFAGVRLDIPSIGVAKHPLVGRLGPTERTAPGVVPVVLDGVVRGYAWTPPTRSRPLYVSVGHRVSLERALDVVRRCTRSSTPEPLRLADRFARETKGMEKRKKGSQRGSAGGRTA